MATGEHLDPNGRPIVICDFTGSVAAILWPALTHLHDGAARSIHQMRPSLGNDVPDHAILSAAYSTSRVGVVLTCWGYERTKEACHRLWSPRPFVVMRIAEVINGAS
jgi:hypothetical protein